MVERITYQNPENGYTVVRLEAERPGVEAAAEEGGGGLRIPKLSEVVRDVDGCW